MFVPIDNKVLILPIEEEKSQGGIVIPESAQKAKKGKVIAVGPGKLVEAGIRYSCQTKVGDTVYLPNWDQSQTVTIDGKEHRVIEESYLLGYER